MHTDGGEQNVPFARVTHDLALDRSAQRTADRRQSCAPSKPPSRVRTPSAASGCRRDRKETKLPRALFACKDHVRSQLGSDPAEKERVAAAWRQCQWPYSIQLHRHTLQMIAAVFSNRFPTTTPLLNNARPQYSQPSASQHRHRNGKHDEAEEKRESVAQKSLKIISPSSLSMPALRFQSKSFATQHETRLASTRRP